MNNRTIGDASVSTENALVPERANLHNGIAWQPAALVGLELDTRRNTAPRPNSPILNVMVYFTTPSSPWGKTPPPTHVISQP
ncbi:unnamed protein product, partial [Iphiclides podalirius]